MRASLLRSCGLLAAVGLLVVSVPAQPVSAATIDGQFDQTGRLGAGTVFNLPVLGRGGIPAAGVGSVALNVTVTGPSATSFVTVWPTGQPRPNASNLNFVAGQTVPNMVIVPIGAGGQISIFNESGTTDVLVDVLGWFPTGPSFTGLTPARLLDSRVPPGGTVDGAFNGIGQLGSGTVFSFPVSGRGGVPATGVGSVALNVTVARPSATSFLSVWPAGQPRPNASNLNFVAGQTVPNMVIVPIGAGGQISMFHESGTTDVLVDVLGWFPIGASFTGLTPGRLLDTRVPSGGTIDGAFSGVGPIGAATVFDLRIAGRGGVPVSGGGSVALNVTVARPSAASFLTVWPKGQPRPNASNLNYTPGQTVPNMVIVPVGADGQISIINESGTTDVLVDVLGWFPTVDSFTGLTPARLLDSRLPLPQSANCENPPNSDLRVTVETDLPSTDPQVKFFLCGMYAGAAALPGGPSELLLVAFDDRERLAQRAAELTGSPVEEVRNSLTTGEGFAVGNRAIVWNPSLARERRGVEEGFIFKIGVHEWYHTYTSHQFYLDGLPKPSDRAMLEEPVWMTESTAEWFALEQATIYGYGTLAQRLRDDGARYGAPRFEDLSKWETFAGLLAQPNYEMLPHVGDVLVWESSRMAFLRTYWYARARTTEPWQTTFQAVFGIDVPAFYARVKQHMLAIQP